TVSICCRSPAFAAPPDAGRSSRPRSTRSINPETAWISNPSSSSRVVSLSSRWGSTSAASERRSHGSPPPAGEVALGLVGGRRRLVGREQEGGVRDERERVLVLPLGHHRVRPAGER